jgi:hypothetical protein
MRKHRWLICLNLLIADISLTEETEILTLRGPDDDLLELLIILLKKEIRLKRAIKFEIMQIGT